MLKSVCKYTVTVQRKDQIMTKFVNEDSFTIGRSVDCAISLTEDSISRVHLVVYRRQDQVWIEDKGSSNGTFVNGTKMAQNVLVNVAATDK
ncbi:MAG: FHA domain-containing protein, partial [Proteobacteria bacterium]